MLWIRRAKEAYLSGIFELEEYSTIKNRIEKELLEIGKQNSERNHAPDIREKIRKAMEEFNLLPESDIVSRKKLLKTFIDNISISRNGITITYR